jgi:hypothetical protein
MSEKPPDIGGSTIWVELARWGERLPPWQRYIVGTATTHGPLSAAQIGVAYRLFQGEHGLAQPLPNPLIPTIAARPSDPLAAKLVLNKVDDIAGVNALQSSGALTFGPELTVIYGANGTGKSGYARLLANACYSRLPPTILPDIYAEGQRPPVRATFHVIASDGAASDPIAFPGDGQVTPLKRITVFDAAVARHHLSQTSAFDFKPVGFEVFPQLTRVCAELSRLLEAEISKRSQPNNFPQAFLGGATPTAVHALVERLGPDTDVAALRALAAYGPNESARITELDAQLVALRAQSPQALRLEREQALADVKALRSQLEATAKNFSPTATQERVARIDDAKEKSSAAAALGTEQFRRPFFTAVGTPAWVQFAAAAHALAAQEGEGYPKDEDRCLLCERPFDDSSRTHVAALLTFVESDARRRANQAIASLNSELGSLRQLDLASSPRRPRRWASRSFAIGSRGTMTAPAWSSKRPS